MVASLTQSLAVSLELVVFFGDRIGVGVALGVRAYLHSLVQGQLVSPRHKGYKMLGKYRGVFKA